MQRWGDTVSFVGRGRSGAADGTGTAATFKEPWGFALAPGLSAAAPSATAVLFDTGNNLVRTVDVASRRVRFLVGSGGFVNADGAQPKSRGSAGRGRPL